MIQKLYVVGLNNREKPLDLNFYPDLNLLTGKMDLAKPRY